MADTNKDKSQKARTSVSTSFECKTKQNKAVKKSVQLQYAPKYINSNVTFQAMTSDEGQLPEMSH